MNRDILLMSAKERQRKAILEGVIGGHFTLEEAAKRLKVCKRQARRILRRYEKEGDKGLIHKHRGKQSNHRCDRSLKEIVLEQCKTTYAGFGPTLAAEKLSEQGYSVHPETLRLWLNKEGIWIKERKKLRYRKQRKRKSQFGEMLQLDGSFHYWFGNEKRMDCLMNLVDDATGITMAFLAEEETTEAAMRILKKWIERYGIPKSIYVDLKTVYVPHITLKAHDGIDEFADAFTHFSKACDKLGIEIIRAYSPQAKGRVERKHGVFQDRFVKELKLRNIDNMEEANQLLEQYFLPHINLKFAVKPLNPMNGHRELNFYGNLDQIFCWEYIRKIQNDWTITFKGKRYQLDKTPLKGIRPRQPVIVRRHLDTTISIWKGESFLHYEEINFQKDKTVIEKKERMYNPTLQSSIAKKNKGKTPWRRPMPLKEGKQIEQASLS